MTSRCAVNKNRSDIENDIFSTFLVQKNCVTLMKKFVADWYPSSWDLDFLAKCTVGQTVSVKMGQPYTGDQVPKESDCSFKSQDLGEFFRFLATNRDTTTFRYAGYTHFAILNSAAQQFHTFDWSWAGLKDVGSSKSTLWAGSTGSFTPCHQDSYGCNLHAQIIGCKEWLLWPPDYDLGATRLPYEESSTFSSVDVLDENYAKSALRIVVSPGEIIFIPKHWWHLARNLETSVSINTWIELSTDSVDRIQEAITRLLICSLKGSESPQDWVNPGEEISKSHENEMFLRQAINQSNQTSGSTSMSRKDDESKQCYFIIDKAATTSDSFIQRIPLPKHPSSYKKSSQEETDKSVVDTLINLIVCDRDIMNKLSAKLLNCSLR